MVNQKNRIYNLPSEKEIERITKYFSDPNCKGANEGLMPDASELDKEKYDICQSISHYKRVNKLTPSELAKKIKVNQGKVDDILFGRFFRFNLEELISYIEKLNGHLEVRISYEEKKSSPKVR